MINVRFTGFSELRFMSFSCDFDSTFDTGRIVRFNRFFFWGHYGKIITYYDKDFMDGWKCKP